MLARVVHTGTSLRNAAFAPLRCPDEIIANNASDVHSFRHNGDDRALTTVPPGAGSSDDDRSVQSERSRAPTLEPVVFDSDGDLLGDLYRQGREIAWFLPTHPKGVVPNAPMVWGPQPYKGHIFFSDWNSGLWSVKLVPDNRRRRG